MRGWINLMEAKKAPPVVDHAARAQDVYNRVMQVAATLARTHYEFRTGWDQTWSKLIRDGVAKARQVHDANQADEAAYYKDEGKPFTPVSFNIIQELPDITAQWWDQTVKDAAYMMEADAKYEYEDYQDAHPRTEMSDEMSALHDQLRMTQAIRYYASDTIEGMTKILEAIDGFDSLNTIESLTRSVEDFIKKVLPAIMTICLYMGAKKS